MKSVWLTFLLFAAVSIAYLHRVPGLLGDEGSEGENTYQIIKVNHLALMGERSYISPLLDYARVPFVLALGYTSISLRILTLLFSLSAYWLFYAVLKKSFGEDAGLMALVMLVFGPIYILYQRLGWAITLIPFFAALVIWLVSRPIRGKWFWAGLAAGLGLGNHLLFLPALAGIVAGLFVYSTAIRNDFKGIVASYLKIWPAFLGLAAGFGPQVYVLLSRREDQGSPGGIISSIGIRLKALPDALAQTLSGSSYIARYTGAELSVDMMKLIIGALVFLLIVGLVKNWRSRYWWAWVVGLGVQVMVLLLIVDRFTLRYLVVFSLGVWMMAGVGLAGVVEFLGRRIKIARYAPVVVAISLVCWMSYSVLAPFLANGGSLNEFSLGNRTDRAAAFVDTRELVKCVKGAGPVWSENVHIRNRLRYLSYGESDIELLSEDVKDEARWLVYYRFEGGGNCSLFQRKMRVN